MISQIEVKVDPPHRSIFVGSIIMARALLAAALSNDFVKLRLQL